PRAAGPMVPALVPAGAVDGPDLGPRGRRDGYCAGMAALELDLADDAATRAAGAALGRALRGGDVVALVGDLGAGKTTLATGVVAGAGGDVAVVASPTFALVNDYGGPLPIAHIDLYRIEREREL